MYHLNSHWWSYTPPTKLLSTKLTPHHPTLQHLTPLPDLNELYAHHYTIVLYQLHISLCLHPSITLIPARYHPRSLVTWAVTVSPPQVWGSLKTYPNGPGFSGYCWWNSPTACNPSINIVGSHVTELFPVQHIRYFNWFWYIRLLSTLETWYTASPSTSAAGGELTRCPAWGS